MSRRIVFAGGMQTRALARVYRAEVAGPAGDDVVFIGTGAVGTDAARSTLLLADILAMEVDEDGDAIPAADLPTRASIVRVPNIYCDFLWPFAGRAHPNNRGAFVLPGGPYPAEHGDRYLDGLAAEGVPLDEAIRRYLAMDIVAEGELESRLADRLKIQQQLDAAGGYDLAGFIGDRFRQEKLFNTRQRITMPLLRRLLEQLFAKLGVQGWSADHVRRVPFPAGAQPVHPGVAQYFGLAWVEPGQLYPVNEEGFFTFEDFCRRYWTFTWNERLHRGIQTAASDPAAALSDLEAGLAASPDSPLGRIAFAAARRAAGLGGDGPDGVIDEDSYDPDEQIPASAAAAPPPEMPAGQEAAPAAEEPALDHAGPAESPAFEETPDAGHPPEDEPALAPSGPIAAEEAVAQEAVTEEPVAEEAGGDEAVAESAGPEGEVIDGEYAEVEPEPEPEQAAEAPAPPPTLTRFPAPAAPAGLNMPVDPDADHGFTPFGETVTQTELEGEIVIATPGADLIEVLPHLLPAFADLSSAVDRPFEAMPEVMPPPPLRPLLPPEVPGEEARPGLLSRLLGRK